MDESDLQPVEPRSRLAIDQLGSAGREVVESRRQILDLEGDVMHPRAALGEEPPHRRLLAQSGEQLDTVVTHPHRGGSHPLLLHRLAMLERRPEQPLVGLDRAVEVLHGHSEMVDCARIHLARS